MNQLFLTNPFECIMIICFGLSWPAAILKTYRAKKVSGKSLLFMILIFTGYLSGIVNKITNGADFVIVFYCLNAFLVFIELYLTLLYGGIFKAIKPLLYYKKITCKV